MSKREVFFLGTGRYEDCEIVFDGLMSQGIMLVRRDNGEERVCVTDMGTWCAPPLMDMAYDALRLRAHDLEIFRPLVDRLKLTPDDERRLEALRTAMSGRSRYDGQGERADEFLVRLLDETLTKLRHSEGEMLAWRCVAQSWTPGGSEYCTPTAVQDFVRQRREEQHKTMCDNVRMRRDAARCQLPAVLAEPAATLAERDPASVIALGDIALERVRQIEGEGWSVEHDDRHDPGELAKAAAAYAQAAHTPMTKAAPPPAVWPWSGKWWKPGSLVRSRVKAGALLVAEMARHYRSAPTAAHDGALAQGVRAVLIDQLNRSKVPEAVARGKAVAGVST